MRGFDWPAYDHGEDLEGISSPSFLEFLKGPPSKEGTLPKMTGISESPSIEENARHTPVPHARYRLGRATRGFPKGAGD